jgi:hypothetical protein
MYQIVLRGQLDEDLKKASKTSPSIQLRLEEFGTNPLAKAIKTNIPIIGEYYVNAGRYCILFDVDSQSQKVEIIAVVLDNLLHKILSGRIPPATAIN